MSSATAPGTAPTPLAADAAAPGATAPESGRRMLGRTVLAVVGFWWAGTGLIFALQRDDATRLLAAVGCGLLALWGIWLLHVTRSATAPRELRRAFMGGALLWLWVSAALWAGWIVGLPTAPPGPGPSWPVALAAIRATAFHEILGIAVLCIAYGMAGTNQAGWLGLAVFWATQALAKLNIFFGVANPGTRYLPAKLQYLAAYFGPPENSPLLPVSVVGLAALGGWLFWRFAREGDPARRQVACLLGVLVALAAVEHAFLGTSWEAPLWDVFLRARGG